MENLLKTNNYVFFIKYIKSNKILSIVSFYFIVSILLKIIFSINILIPCLWKTFFNIECPGCGLTRAFINILHCNFIEAFNHNPLVFIVVPAGMFYFYIDFTKFKKRLKKSNNMY